MQVISGKYRARKLLTIDLPSTRPTLARVKESIFNLIQGHSNDVVLDLFAGSGAMGIECISRGSQKVFFVDSQKQAVETIKSNTRGMVEEFEIIMADYNDALEIFKQRGIKFDIIFLDPPYKSGFTSNCLNKISEYNLLNEGGIVVVEHDGGNNLQNFENHYIIKKSKKYGIAYVDVLEALTKG